MADGVLINIRVDGDRQTNPGHPICALCPTSTITNEVELIGQPNGRASDIEIPQPPHLLIARTTSIAVANDARPQALPDDLKNESKIALTLFTVSAACVLLLLGELKEELNDPSIFGVYTSLSYISLISSILMFLLILYRPNIRCLVKIVRFTMYVSLGSLLYASVSAYFALVL